LVRAVIRQLKWNVHPCLRGGSRSTREGGLAKDVHGVLAVRDCGDIEHRDAVARVLRDEEALVRAVVGKTRRHVQTDLRGGSRHNREACLTQDIHGILAVGDGGNIEHRDAVACCLSHEKALARAVVGEAVRRLQTALRGRGGVRVEVQLPDHVVGNAVEEGILCIEVVDEHALIAGVGEEETVVHAIQRHTDHRRVEPQLVRPVVGRRFRVDRLRVT